MCGLLCENMLQSSVQSNHGENFFHVQVWIDNRVQENYFHKSRNGQQMSYAKKYFPKLFTIINSRFKIFSTISKNKTYFIVMLIRKANFFLNIFLKNNIMFQFNSSFLLERLILTMITYHRMFRLLRR